MKIIQFPNINDTVYFTEEQYEKFQTLNFNFKNSISPGEAEYYKSELEMLIQIGKSQRLS